MNKKNLNQMLASIVMVAGFSAVTAQANGGPPRGQAVDPLAANCSIGKFPQTSKAGPYNVLCDVMEDSEKCLALIKGSFSYNGETVEVEPVSEEDKLRGQYCLSVLRSELGL